MKQIEFNAPAARPPALINALRRVLRPLARLLISYGVTLPVLTETMKSVMVEVAEREFALADKRPSDSRINLLTGVHRKDVRRLRSQGPTTVMVPQSVSMGSQVVARWLADRRFLDVDGRPKPLPVRVRHAKRTSFETLVASVARQDLRARVVLEELTRLGIVSVDEDNFVHLDVDAFVPDESLDEKAYYFGLNVGDHLAAGAHNLTNQRPPLLERAVSYHGLTEQDIETLAAIAEQMGMAALKDINRRAMTMKRRAGDQPGPRRRMNFGIYFYSAPDPDEDRGPEQ